MRNLLKAAWASAAPGLVPFVMLVSFNAVDLLSWTSLGRLGVAAVLVLFVSLAHLLWKGRYWAAVPSLLVFGWSMVHFSLSLLRVADKYLSVAPGAYTDLFMMCAPHLVIIVICLTLAIVVIRGMRVAWNVGSLRLNKLFVGVFILWVLVLAGDAWYQDSGWRRFNQPGDLMVRLCLDDEDLRKEASERLLGLGPQVVPELLVGVSTPDPDLECMRKNSSRLILAFGAEAVPPLLDAAKDGDRGAVRLLARLGDKRVLDPLRDILQQLPPDAPKELRSALEKAIASLQK